MDDLKTDAQLDYGADPIGEEIKIVAAVLVNRKQHGEINELKYHVTEKDWKSAVQLAPNHNDGEEQPESKVAYPERELDLGIQGFEKYRTTGRKAGPASSNPSRSG